MKLNQVNERIQILPGYWMVMVLLKHHQNVWTHTQLCRITHIEHARPIDNNNTLHARS